MRSSGSSSCYISLILFLGIFRTIQQANGREPLQIDVNFDEGRPPKSSVYLFDSSRGDVFSLYNPPGATATLLFQISEVGHVTSKQEIEYKIGGNNEYDLTVLERPRGETYGGIAKTLTIRIIDKNNFHPVFQLSQGDFYEGFVMEGTAPNQIVRGLESCHATDRDTSGIKEYKIISGNQKGYFKVLTVKRGERHGVEIKFLELQTTNKPIKREDGNPYIMLTVQVTDGGTPSHSGTAKIRVTIEDANDHAPVFEEPRYSADIAENTPVKTSVLRVRATDQDDGTNGGIYYYMDPINSYFTIDAITGVIRVARMLNYQTKVHTLTIYARDRGPAGGKKSSPTTVVITIKDDISGYPPPADPNPGPNTSPFFAQTRYSFSIREDFPVKGALLAVRASDNDKYGPNKDLRYSLTGDGVSKFSIDSVSGVVTLISEVDYETTPGNKVYDLTVTATDRGGSKPATTRLLVEIQDVDENRNAPIFNPEQREAEVAEDVTIGTSVITVSASDQDSGQDGTVVYSIVGGTGLALGAFWVDPNSGVVKTASSLDREITDHYTLIVKASDNATFPRSARLFLMIKVKDVDDNFPHFSLPIYMATVPEKKPIGTFVTVISGIDSDINAIPSYAILSPTAYYKIEPATGVIRTKAELDQSDSNVRELQIVVQVTTQKSAKGQVNITVTSKVNRPPVFKNLPYSVKVPEEMGPIPNLYCIAAVDSHFRPVQYTIAPGGDTVFEIDTDSGRLYTRTSFNYENIDRYNLRLEARTGSVQEVASTSLTVQVTEEKDSPKFIRDEYAMKVSEDAASGTTLVPGLFILDSDTTSDQFDCSIENINSFHVMDDISVKRDSDRCFVITKAALDARKASKYSFHVRATDRNNPNMFAKATVDVTVTDKNNHKPQFLQDSYWMTVPSSTPAGSSLVTLTAEDMDIGSNGQIGYELQKGEDKERFRLINKNQLVTESTLVPNKRYELQIKATDSGNPAKNALVTVFVSVQSTSESPIVFDGLPDKRIAEDAGANTVVFTAKATKSGTSNGITYELVGGYKQNAAVVFIIDAKTGVVKLRDNILDYETQSSFPVAVRATYTPTNGAIKLASEIVVRVNIDDVNDNAPKFVFGSTKNVVIDNYSKKGTLVITAKALDADSSKFGPVSYAIDRSSSSSNLPFTIDASKGEITSTKEILYTAGASYKIIVEATDKGRKSTKATVNVNVMNTPRPPRFQQDVYTAPVSEIAGVGDTVTTVKAQYSKPNAFLKYAFLSGNTDNTFCVDGKGDIFVAKSLDREKVAGYRLRMRVSLGQHFDDTTVYVNLTDINDDPPHFVKQIYTREIKEELRGSNPVGAPVVAFDHDFGKNGKITYSILYGIHPGSKTFFGIDTNTGQIFTKKELDYEKAKSHTLFIKAEDNGDRRLSAIAQVNIKVIDENDNSPTFAASFYRAKVSLSANKGDSVLQVHTIDLDSGSNGDITYTIVQGNEEEAFKINELGVILVDKSLTTVAADKFKLKVQASDKGKVPRSATVFVEINVFLPDGPPIFVVSPVTVYVKEGVPANHRVAGVKAATSEALTYTLLSGNEAAMFRINPNTGSLDATRELDYEEQTRYELRIESRDTRDRSAVVTLIINVLNINDNKPTFIDIIDGQIDRKAIGTCSPTDIDVGQVITRLGAYDKDKGDTITFEVPDNIKDLFDIDSRGVVTAKKPLKDLKLPKVFPFRVKAKDDGKPPQENDVNVRLIFVHYRPDQKHVRVAVREDTPSGSVIATVPRYLPNGTMVLLIPEKANFSVEANGDVRLLAPLDFETDRFHRITVREDAGGITNDIDVEIEVLDVNDNRPEFTQQERLATVNTNSRAGAKVYQLEAKDKDGGSSGLVGYQLVTPKSSARRKRRSLPQSPFTINPKTRQVEVAGPLNDKRYNNDVFAFDHGIPRLASDTITLNIDASEAGQLPPRFSRVSYRFNVSEDAKYLSLVGTIEARSISGARLKYTITKGNIGDKFIAMDDGKILLNSLLDYERDQSVFFLKVTATEQILKGLSSIVDVRIDVINANDHFPFFMQQYINIPSLREDTPVGSVITTVTAMDCDCMSSCRCAPGVLEYSLEPSKKDGGKFYIDKVTGSISVSITLDYELKKQHLLKVYATDKGKRRFRGLCFVRVTLTNTNDNQPRFLESAYEFRVAELATRGSVLAAVLATDADGDAVRYSKTGGATQFSVDPNTGVITLSGDLDKNKNQYTIEIQASDPGGSASKVSVTFNVADTNDHPPRFKSCGTVTLSENDPRDTKITQVTATDEDRGQNGQVTYSIEGAESQNLFSIDPRTGVVRSLTSLDREGKESYAVIVKAEDGSPKQDESERLLWYCFLTVNVDDVNDNRPYFLGAKYFGSVYTGAPNGTRILTVQATDADKGSNAAIKYSLLKSEGGLFRLDSRTGVLRTNAGPDKLRGKANKKFLLEVSAKDVESIAGTQPGKPTKYSTMIEILISDQEPPKFEKQEYTVDVAENIPTGKSILKIKATTRTGSEISYENVDTNPVAKQMFRIEPDGTIKTGSAIDYEAGTKYEMQFAAKDKTSQLYSTCKVVINIDDKNDVTPSFLLAINTRNARVLENKSPPTEVISMKAVDADGSAIHRLVRYEIKPNPDFNINANTGMITTKTRLDRETKAKYDVEVTATDGSLRESATLYITVVDQNDQSPIFKPRVYPVSVPEDTKAGVGVLDLYATDADVGENAKITYFISAGDPHGKFTVDTEEVKGVLKVNGKLDYETKKSYNLKVTATDGLFSDTADVVVTITDVNDLPPVFSSPLYESKIEENTGPGRPVVKVTASDVDSDSITFSLDNRGKSFFVITRRPGSSPRTFIGEIMTGNTPLDREVAPIKVFTVIASDGKYKTEAEVRVNLTDVNDNAPRFPASPYIGYVEENKPAGTSVMYIQAVDDDDPLAGGNAKIIYELTDSAGDKFSIDPKTGLIKTKVEFDREKPPNRFNVTVKATDAGNPRRSGSVDGIIYISDANDHKPKFTEKFFRGTVPENAPPGYSVLKVSATDEDEGPNAVLEFVVQNGNEPHAFYIDPFNGTVLVSGILDYETKKQYQMTVSVSDRGMDPLAADAVAYVVIDVLDANDNAPIFIPNTYNKTVLEDQDNTVGKPVLTVTAVDKDSGSNGNFTFAILPRSDPDDIFTIEPDPKNASIGIIKTRVPLDRETIPFHHLIVTATDIGGLEGRADVRITVNDVNDNGPWFMPRYFYGKVKEGTSLPQFVTKLKAFDPDMFVKDQKITFKIYNGTEGENFRLDPATITNDSVVMEGVGTFDREKKPEWKIAVEAIDNVGPKPQNNVTYVFVDVEDVNDNIPEDGELTIIVNAYGGNFTGGVIGKPYYKDDDFDGDTTNTYRIDSQTPGNYFKVTEGSGDITAPAMIPMGEYKLKIFVTDTSRDKTVTSTVNVIVRRIDPEAVDNGVGVEFIDMRKIGYFVGDYYDGFKGVLTSALGVPRNDIKIFSVQRTNDAHQQAVDVFFAVATKDGYMKPLDITNRLVNQKKPLEKLGLKVGALGIDECAKNKQPFPVGKRTNVIETSSAFSVASGDYGKVPAPSSSLTIVSMDVNLKCKREAIFEPDKHCKPHNPCLHGGKCHTTVPKCPGFVCKCPPGYHGPLCELTTRTFEDKPSYIWLPPLTSYSLSDLEFEFMTKTPDGLLLYQGPESNGGNNGLKDFIAVVLRGGRIELRISLGLDPVTVKMDKGPTLHDGEWHTVQLLRDKKDIQIIIDRCSNALLEHKADGSVVENRRSCHVNGRMLGRAVYLDGFGPLQIGGVSNPNMDYPDIPYKGFKGCIRNIKDNHKLYDLKNPLKVVNAPEGCKLANACPDCKGKGYCEPLMARNSICVCDVGHSGTNCDGRGKASYYLDNSFTEYQVAARRRRRRELVPPPKSLFNQFYTNIAMQVKLDPDASDVVVFLASNRMGTEFQRIDVKDHKLRYVMRLGTRMMILSFPQLNVTDGIYHTVVVRRRGDYAVMQLDFDGYTIGSLHSRRTLLDMSGGELFSGGLPNITIVRVIEAIVSNDGSAVENTDVLTGELAYTAGMGMGMDVRNLHLSGPLDWTSSRKRRAAEPLSVIGDFGGCIAGSSVNGADLESDPNIRVNRQNVLSGCPCLQNHCLNGGTCVNAIPPYCVCPPGWTGLICENVVTQPPVGARGTRIMHPAIIAVILVVLIAILFIMGAVIFKRRPEPVAVYADDTDTGHVHDNVRLYHDDGGGEEDNMAYDITKLMKYTYVETTIAPPSVAPSTARETQIPDPVDKQPLLQSQGPGPDRVFGLTGGPSPKMPKYVEGDDVGDFITTRVTITDREVFLAVDELHIYRYEGDDTEVDDLSEIDGEDEEDDEYEPEFDFLKQWGSKFDKLAKMYDQLDED